MDWLPLVAAVVLISGDLILQAYLRRRATLRHQATHEALVIQERRLRDLFEHTSELLCSVDAGGRILALNGPFREFCRSFGRKAEPGMVLSELLTGSVRDTWERVMAQSELIERHTMLVRFEGPMRDRFLDVVVTPMHGTAGGLTLFGREITARIDAQQALGSAQGQIDTLARKVGLAEITDGVLHNLKNALNGVNVTADGVSERVTSLEIGQLRRLLDMLTEQPDLGAFFTEDPRANKVVPYLQAVTRSLELDRQLTLEHMRKLKRALQHVGAVVGTQQRYARAGTGMTLSSLPEVIDAAVQLQTTALASRGIQVDVALEDVSSVAVDPHAVMQILLNLLGNAAEAVSDSPDPTIRVTAELGLDRVRVRVTDNGCGIDDDDQARLFQHGFTTRPDGHGFGLYSSRTLARERDGDLWCTSDGPGTGAEFVLELPANVVPFERTPPLAVDAR